MWGFKRQLVINDRGAMLTGKLIPGTIDDRVPVSRGAKGVFGMVFGDMGDCSQTLCNHRSRAVGVELRTPRRKHMKKWELPQLDQMHL